MPLPHSGGAHAPRLVYRVRVLVEPPGFRRKLRRDARDRRAFFLFEEETVHHGIGAGGRSRDDRRGARRRDRREIAVAHAPRADFFRERAPRGGIVSAGTEIFAAFPVGSFEIRIAPFFRGEFRARLDREVIDFLENLVREREVFFAFPRDALARQQVVITARAEPDRAIARVRDPRIRHGVEIQIDHVVERAHERGDDELHLGGVAEIDSAQHERSEIADDEIARARLFDDDDVPVLRFDGRRDAFDGAHVLRDFRAEVRAVNDAAGTVGIRAVHRVAVEREGRSRLDRGFQNEPHEIPQRNFRLADARVVHAVAVALFPFFAVKIFQRVAFDGADFVRTHQVPFLRKVFSRHFPEKIRVADRREHVVRLHAVVAVVRAQLQKIENVLVPDVEINGDGAGAHAELVDGDRRVVREPDPAHDAARRALEAANVAPARAHLPEIKPHAAAELRHLGKAGNAAVDAVERVGNGVDETARKLEMRLARVRHRRRRHRRLQRAEHVVDVLDDAQTAFPLFRNAQMHGDAHEHFLRRLEQAPAAVAYRVSLQHQVQPAVSEKMRPLRPNAALELRDFLRRVIFENVFPVKPFRLQVADFFEKRRNFQLLRQRGDAAPGAEIQQPRGDELPVRRLRGNALRRGAHEAFQRVVRRHARLGEGAEFREQTLRRIFGSAERLADVLQHAPEPGNADRRAQLVDRRALLRALLAIKDEAPRFPEKAALHHFDFDDVLNLLDLDRVPVRVGKRLQQRLDAPDHRRQVLRRAFRPEAVERRTYDARDFFRVVAFPRTVPFDDFHKCAVL